MTLDGFAYQLAPPERPMSGSDYGPSLLWPTLDASGSNDGEDPETWLARRERVKAKGINGNGMGTPLAIAVKLWPNVAHVKRWPTLQASDGDGRGRWLNRPKAPPATARGQARLSEMLGSRLNPAWCEVFMGWPLGYLTGLPLAIFGRLRRGRTKKVGNLLEPAGASPGGGK